MKQRNIQELFYHVLSKWKLIFCVGIICAIGAAIYSALFVSPTYYATSKLYINEGRKKLQLTDLESDSWITMDYTEVFKTWEVHEMVDRMLNKDYAYEDLQKWLSITTPDSTRILYITTEAAQAELAAALANAYAQAGKAYIKETMTTQEPTLFSVAIAPAEVTSMSKNKIIIASFVLGCILAGMLVLFSFVHDERPHSTEDILVCADIPTLAIVPRIKSAPPHKRNETF